LACLFLASKAEITHTTESKGLRIPIGEYTQFRLAGSGVHDDNLKADISAAKYKISLKAENSTQAIGNI